MYAFPDAVIMVFCKAPVPGQVKTRLMPTLSAEQAAQLHCELSELTLQTATQNRLCEVQLWCSPTIEHPFFVGMEKKYGVELQTQQGEDLGERMHNALVQSFKRYKNAIIIGCDCPSLTPESLRNALSWLGQGVQSILAPAEDGGYVLIGLKQPQPSLFENMPWGTSEVLAITRSRIQMLGLACNELEAQWDLDTIDDLIRYRKLKLGAGAV